jgi:hypothetical protein
MTTRYVDPAASGANNGSSWINAWTNIQSAFDTAVAGDVVFCRGTQTISARVDIDTNQGNTTSGFIYFIGCNASGTNDGTRFTIDGNNAAIDGLYMNSDLSYVWLENIGVTRCGGYGFYNNSGAGTKWVMNNCAFNYNGSGLRTMGLSRSTYFRCVARNNTNYGFALMGTVNLMLACCIHHNGSHGVNCNGSAPGILLHNLIYKNGGDGIYEHAGASGVALIYGNTIDSNGGNGILISSAASHVPIIANRITNHITAGKYAINCNGVMVPHGLNYFENNNGDNVYNAALAKELLINGMSTNVEDQGNVNQGYTALTAGSEDYNLRSDASLRRTAVAIPVS